MNKIVEALSWLTLFLLLIFLSGCSTYYAVRDPHSGNTFYTREIGEAGGGAVKLVDEKTKTAVTIQNPEVRILDSAEFNSALSEPPVAKVKPVGIRNRDETY